LLAGVNRYGLIGGIRRPLTYQIQLAEAVFFPKTRRGLQRFSASANLMQNQAM